MNTEVLHDENISYLPLRDFDESVLPQLKAMRDEMKVIDIVIPPEFGEHAGESFKVSPCPGFDAKDHNEGQWEVDFLGLQSYVKTDNIGNHWVGTKALNGSIVRVEQQREWEVLANLRRVCGAIEEPGVQSSNNTSFATLIRTIIRRNVSG